MNYARRKKGSSVVQELKLVLTELKIQISKIINVWTLLAKSQHSLNLQLKVTGAKLLATGEWGSNSCHAKRPKRTLTMMRRLQVLSKNNLQVLIAGNVETNKISRTKLTMESNLNLQRLELTHCWTRIKKTCFSSRWRSLWRQRSLACSKACEELCCSTWSISSWWIIVMISSRLTPLTSCITIKLNTLNQILKRHLMATLLTLISQLVWMKK